MFLVAETAVSGTAYSFDMLFSYAVPENMSIECGCRVLVPFGPRNSRRIGVVMKLTRKSDVSGLKYLISAVDSTPVLSDEFLRLAFYLHDNCFCTYFDAVKTMIPPAMSVKTEEKFSISDNFSDTSSLSEEAVKILTFVRSLSGTKEVNRHISEFISRNGRKYIDELLENDFLCSDNIFRRSVNDASLKMVKLTENFLKYSERFELTPKQRAVTEFLSEYGEVAFKEVLYMCGVTAVVVNNLISKGVAEDYCIEVLRGVESGCDPKNAEFAVLSDEQNKVYQKVMEQVKLEEPAVFLLHGVTGSGKTSVFEKLIRNTVELERQVLVLIPEISLTPQMLTRFRSLFGDRVAVMHSGLSLGQRLDEYKRIKRGDADIVIGTRSAVFCPLDNIGLIVIDEEGERSYKSETSPRYFTHDVAKRRCFYHNATLLLASATPSVESTYFAERGVYRLLELTERYGKSTLPEVYIADMNEERKKGNYSEFSTKLIDEVNANLERGEQSILLLNRRGYHTVITCCDCSEPISCPNCSVPLTYHKKNNRLMCHYCGYSELPSDTCRKCGSKHLKSIGFGTQKLEEEMQNFFPKARILRMDADTVFSRYSYEQSFNAFRKGEYDIMVGTQMIGKGLDFPDVTLVGVISVDKALYSGDFRSYERTFSLITQVVGRSGRSSKRGRAVLQTSVPDHYVMKLASVQDYTGFYKEEIALRRTMIFPPFCDMCVFCFSGTDEERVKEGAEASIGLMNQKLHELQPKTPVRVLGPVRETYGRINGKYRYRIIMKCKNTAEIRQFISSFLKESVNLKEMKKIGLYADMNGDLGV